MNEHDIELYLKAKKHQRYQKFASSGILILEVAWLILYLTGSTNNLLNMIAIGLLIGFLAINQGFPGVSQADLLDVLKRQINHDPKALAYLAEQSASQNHKQ